MTRTVVVGTAGHIDHGKSTLVTALTGTDPDRLKEEKARGITIELGFAHAALTPALTASFVDVPGHERFVRAMLAGAGGIDLVLLVVAADESVMPQTREHFDICRLLGLRHGIVVLTKVDAAEPGMADLVAAEVQELVAGSFLEGAAIVPVSARTGAGLDRLRAEMIAVAAAIPTRPDTGPVRLPIDRAFTLKGFGTVVTGTLVQGRLAGDDELVVLPDERPVKVRGLHVHGGPRLAAVAGERVAVNLAAIDVAEVPRGAVLAAPGAFAVSRRADVRLTLLPGHALRHGARVRVHQGTAELLARVAVAGEDGEVSPGRGADVRLRFERPAVMTRRDRLVVRRYSPPVTIGGGVVLDPLPPRPGVRTARGVARMAALAIADDVALDTGRALGVLVGSAGPAGVSMSELGQRLGVSREAVASAVATAGAAGTLAVGGDRVVAQEFLGRSTAAMLSGLAEFHRAQPLAPGIGLEDARSRWFRAVPPAVVDGVVRALVAGGRLVATDTLALATHRVAFSADDLEVHRWIEQHLRDAGLTPPELAALVAASPHPAASVEKGVPLLVKSRQVVRLDTLLYHRETLERLKADVVARKAAGPDGRATVDVKTFKDVYHVTRKFAIPLLEYLDRERVTRRIGETRVVL